MKKIVYWLLTSLLLSAPLQALQIKEELKHEKFLCDIQINENDWTMLSHQTLNEDDFEVCYWNPKLKQKLYILYGVLRKDKIINYRSASSYLYSIFAHPQYKNSFEVMKKIYEESKKNHAYLTFKLYEVKSESDIIFEKKAHTLGPYEGHHDMIRIMKLDHRFLILKVSKQENLTKEEKEIVIKVLKDATVSFENRMS